jgi:hypothetical protein
MLNGANVYNIPLPIDNFAFMLLGSFVVFLLSNYVLFVVYISFTTTSLCHHCGCTYHPFCIGLYMDTNVTHCAKPMCGKLLEFD